MIGTVLAQIGGRYAPSDGPDSTDLIVRSRADRLIPQIDAVSGRMLLAGGSR